MKKFVNLVTVIIIFATVFTSCEKQKFDLSSPAQNGLLEPSTNITVKNGMLYFSNIDEFQRVYYELEESDRSDMIDFNKKIENLVDKKIKIVNSNELKEHKSLDEFNSIYNFKSLRKKIEKEMDAFNQVFDPKDMEIPEDKYVQDIILQTLLNEDSELQIGDTIYKVLVKGDIVAKISNEDYDLARQINDENFLNFIDNKNVLFIGDYSEKSKTCKANYTKTGYRYYYDSYHELYKRLYLKIGIRNDIIIANRKMVSRVVAQYYDVNRNKWVKSYTTYIDSEIKGKYSEGSRCSNIKKDLKCITNEQVGSWGEQRTKKVIGRVYRVANNDVYLHVYTANWMPSQNFRLTF